MNKLTNKQIDVLQLLYLKNKQIEQVLGLKTCTVERRIEKIFKKLGVGNRTAALNRGFSEGYIKICN